MSGLTRVIVGVSGTPGCLPALRYAARIARLYDATLVPVHAWVPPGGDLADRRCPSTYLRRIWADEARERLKDALSIAWGGELTEIDVRPVVTRGQPGPALVDLAEADDMLVIGAGRHGWLSRLWHGQVSRYCLAHAPCAVLAVPPPALDRLRQGDGLEPRTTEQGNRAGPKAAQILPGDPTTPCTLRTRPAVRPDGAVPPKPLAIGR